MKIINTWVKDNLGKWLYVGDKVRHGKYFGVIKSESRLGFYVELENGLKYTLSYMRNRITKVGAATDANLSLRRCNKDESSRKPKKTR